MSFFTHIDFKFHNIQVYRIIVGGVQRTRFPLNYVRISCQYVSPLPPLEFFCISCKPEHFLHNHTIVITQETNIETFLPSHPQMLCLLCWLAQW